MSEALGVLAAFATALWGGYWFMILRTTGAPVRRLRLMGIGANVVLLSSIAFAFTLGTIEPELAIVYFTGALVLVTVIGFAEFWAGPGQ